VTHEQSIEKATGERLAQALNSAYRGVVLFRLTLVRRLQRPSRTWSRLCRIRRPADRFGLRPICGPRIRGVLSS